MPLLENDRLLAKLLSLLLDYPDSGWSPAVRQAEGLAASLGDEREQRIVETFMAYVRATPLIAVAEEYTATFDLDPATSLHLSYHLTGDSEERGRVLVRLLWEYGRHGFETGGRELPDYLPMMLEFLAICPQAESAPVFFHCFGAVAALADKLEERQSPYHGLLRLVAAIHERLKHAIHATEEG